MATVDVLLPLFGSTAPSPLLPLHPARPGEFFEPLDGVAVRELFESGVFANLFGSCARPETLGLTRRAILLASGSGPTGEAVPIEKITLSL